jgi:hypothetical protein
MSGPVNFRPVGNLRGVYRSGDPTAIAAADARRFRADYGITTFVDLRSRSEVESSGSPVGLLDAGIEWLRCPIENRKRTAIADLSPGEADYCRYYLDILDEAGEAINCALRLIAEVLPAGVAFGCYAGKDRTGIVAALMLELAGNPAEAIARDYSASEGHLLAAIGHFAPKWRKRGITSAEYAGRLRTPAKTFDLLYVALEGGTLLSHMRRRGLDTRLETYLASRLETK